MTDSFADYLDICKIRTDTESDSNMARKIGFTRSHMSKCRKGERFPSADVMLALAARAELDEREALILLNIWRENGKARALYVDMLKKFTAMIAIVFAGFALYTGIDDKALISMAILMPPALNIRDGNTYKRSRSKDYAINRCSSHIVMRQLSPLEMRLFS